MESGLRVFKHPGRDHAWFVATSLSGTILIDNCTSLDAAIQARRDLISRLQSEMRLTAELVETDTGW
jgi:hypothetical protein